MQGLQYNERLDMNISKVNISKFYNDLSDDSDSDMENDYTRHSGEEFGDHVDNNNVDFQDLVNLDPI